MGILNRLRRNSAAECSARQTPHALAAPDARERCRAGEELIRQGLYREALEEFRLAARAGGEDSAESYYNMGVAYDYLCEPKKSVECYERATRFDSEYVEAYCGLGVAFSRVGKGLEAIKACHRAVRLAPNYPDAYNSLALAYFNRGSYPEALKACQKALALDPGYAHAHYTLGLIYADLGDKGQALRQYRILSASDTALADHLFVKIPK